MKTRIAFAAAGMAVMMAGTAFAGQWQQDEAGWKWQENDGTYTTDRGRWIDGNADGIAEYYAFDSTGHCYMNTTTPNGVTVNADGAWVENGEVQTAQLLDQTPYNKDENVSVMSILTKTDNGRYATSDGVTVGYIASQANIEDKGSFYRISDIILMNSDATKEVRLGNKYKLDIAKSATVYTSVGFMSLEEGTLESYLNKGSLLTPGSGDSYQYTVCICPGDYDSASGIMKNLMINMVY